MICTGSEELIFVISKQSTDHTVFAHQDWTLPKVTVKASCSLQKANWLALLHRIGVNNCRVSRFEKKICPSESRCTKHIRASEGSRHSSPGETRLGCHLFGQRCGAAERSAHVTRKTETHHWGLMCLKVPKSVCFGQVSRSYGAPFFSDLHMLKKHIFVQCTTGMRYRFALQCSPTCLEIISISNRRPFEMLPSWGRLWALAAWKFVRKALLCLRVALLYLFRLIIKEVVFCFCYVKGDPTQQSRALDDLSSLRHLQTLEERCHQTCRGGFEVGLPIDRHCSGAHDRSG